MSQLASPPPAEGPVNLPDLELSLRKPRTFISAFFSFVAVSMAILAAVPLFGVLIMLLVRGGHKVASAGVRLFTELPPGAGMAGGGIGNAVVGTLVVITLAALISVPIGVLGAIFLAEFGPKSHTAAVVRFCAKVLTGLPSVLAGLVAFAAVVVVMGRFSPFAGGVALAILMIPTVLLTAEDALRMVPRRMREAAVGMGCTPTQVTLKVVLPTALPAILTGVMLALARAAGETAPLLFTALFSNYWMSHDPMRPVATLAVLIYNFSSSPFPNQIEIAWAASLVLVFIVLVTNIIGQIYTARARRRR